MDAFRPLAEEGVQDRARRARTRRSRSTISPDAPSTPSAAPGARWRACTCASANIRCDVMHNYVIPTRDALEFAKLVERIETEALTSIETRVGAPAVRCSPMARWCWRRSSAARTPKEIVISALGVREGLLYEGLSPEDAGAGSAASIAAREFNMLRSRAPGHGEELFAWTSRSWRPRHLEETPEEKRLRHAACLLSDIGWRAHPDYRGEQSLRPRRQRRLRRRRPSRARLSRARRVLSPCVGRPGGRARMRARWCRRASSTARACSARRCASPISSRRRCPACCRARRWSVRQRPRRADAAARSRRAQQRPAAEPAASIRPPDRRRSGGPRGELSRPCNAAESFYSHIGPSNSPRTAT